jgi:hypothetical protein
LVSNYKQALCIIAGEPLLVESMWANGITSPDIFTEWLEEEHSYLQGLSKEPIQETLEMEYYEHLVELEQYL